MSHGSASAHSHRYSLHLFLKMETSTGLSCLCTHHALWRLWQGLNAWLCALSRGLPRGELSFCLSWLMSANGPGLPTCALQQVGSYLGYTGHQIDVVVTAARDPGCVKTLLRETC